MRELSVVTAGRNDNHGGNFLQRMFWSVRSLSHIAKSPSISMEYICVEWNPDENNLPLHSLEHIWKPLIHDKFSMRFIVVPNNVHQTIRNSDKLNFFQMIAKNVGIRRAKHNTILATTSDVIFNSMFSEIFSNHASRADRFYRCRRVDVDNGMNQNIGLAQQLQYCADHILRTYEPPKGGRIYMEACGDFTMALNKAWATTRGYLELPIFSIHLDSVWALSAIRYNLNQFILPKSAVIYHVEHSDSWTPKHIQELKNKVTTNKIPMLSTEQAFRLAREINVTGMPYNEDNWGLIDYKLDEFVYKVN